MPLSRGGCGTEASCAVLGCVAVCARDSDGIHIEMRTSTAMGRTIVGWKMTQNFIFPIGATFRCHRENFLIVFITYQRRKLSHFCYLGNTLAYIVFLDFYVEKKHGKVSP